MSNDTPPLLLLLKDVCGGGAILMLLFVINISTGDCIAFCACNILFSYPPLERHFKVTIAEPGSDVIVSVPTSGMAAMAAVEVTQGSFEVIISSLASI